MWWGSDEAHIPLTPLYQFLNRQRVKPNDNASTIIKIYPQSFDRTNEPNLVKLEASAAMWS